MATTDPLPLGLDTFAILRHAARLLVQDLRIPLTHVLIGLTIFVPTVGPLAQVALLGVAFQFADESLGYDPPSSGFLRRYVLSLLAGLLVALAIGVGLVLFVAPGVVLAVKFALVAPAVWLGERGPIGALEDSWELTTDELQTVLAVGLVVFVPMAVIALGAVLAFVPFDAFLQTGGTLGPWVLDYPRLAAVLVALSATLGALWTAAATVMYRGFEYL